MKHAALPAVLALASAIAFAQANPEDHAAHHPEGAASSPVANTQALPANTQTPVPDKFAQQMQMMQDMHKRMQAARTPGEKQALMGEHMRLMQSGMEMMSQTGQGSGGTAMGGMGGGPSAGTAGNPPDQAGPAGMGGMNGMMAMHGSMERRMAMMEQMMQMMVDREGAMPRK